MKYVITLEPSIWDDFDRMCRDDVCNDGRNLRYDDQRNFVDMTLPDGIS